MQATWILYRIIWTLNLVATALVIWRLWTLGLHRTYRYFFASMSLTVVRTAILFPFSPNSLIYARLWLWTQPLLWISYVFVVFELHTLVLKRYPGVYGLGRVFFAGAIAISVGISALTVLPTVATTLETVRATPAAYRPEYYYAMIERSLATGLAVFLLLLLVLVVWFSIPLSRNLLTHCLVYSSYFLANNVVFLYRHTGGKDAAYLSNVIKLSMALGCFVCWLLFLSRQGEDRTASLHLGRNPYEERRLLGRLEDFNAALLRTARK